MPVLSPPLCLKSCFVTLFIWTICEMLNLIIGVWQRKRSCSGLSEVWVIHGCFFLDTVRTACSVLRHVYKDQESEAWGKHSEPKHQSFQRYIINPPCLSVCIICRQTEITCDTFPTCAYTFLTITNIAFNHSLTQSNEQWVWKPSQSRKHMTVQKPE